MTYDAQSIHKFSDLEGIVRNPHVYVGDDEKTGLWITVREVIDNALDECSVCKGSELIVIREGNRFIVYDTGRGIPVEINKATKKSAMEMVFTMTHAGSKHKGGLYGAKTSTRGVHGVGAAVSAALSKRLVAYTYRSGWHSLAIVDSKPGKVVKSASPEKDKNMKALLPFLKRKGTAIFIDIDKDRFKATIENEILFSYLRNNAFFLPGIKITLIIDGKTDVFFHKNEKAANAAIESYVKENLPAETIKSKPFIHSSDTVQAAFVITDSVGKFSTFACAMPTPENGTHYVGFEAAVEKALAPYVKKSHAFETAHFVMYLSGFLNYNVNAPSFSGQAKQKLKTTHASKDVEKELISPLSQFFAKNKGAVREAILRAVEYTKMMTRHEKEIHLEKAITRSTLPLALISCPRAKPEDRELFIVEGESAKTPAKGARNEKYQEVLPLRGKPLNVYKMWKKVPSNVPVQNILKVIGYSKDDPKMLKARVRNKIIIMNDADVDGYHIRILILAILWRFFPQAFYDGKVYYAQAPLYSLTTAKGAIFGNTISDLKAQCKKLQVKFDPTYISRMKGWGEASPQQLAEFGFNPETRVLVRVPPFDSKEAEEAFKGLIIDKTSEFRTSLLDGGVDTETEDGEG